VAGVVMGAGIYYFSNHNLYLLIVLGALLYALSLAILGFFRREDWELVKAAINFRQRVEPDIPPTTNL